MKIRRSIFGILLNVYIPGRRKRMDVKLIEAVHNAKKNDDAAIIKTMTDLLRQGADINGKPGTGDPVLHMLCANGLGAAAVFALENGARTYGGSESALSTAAKSLNLVALRALIEPSALSTGATTAYSNAINSLFEKLPSDSELPSRPGVRELAITCLQELMKAGGEISNWKQRDIVNRFQYLAPLQPGLSPVIELAQAQGATGTAELERVLKKGIHPDLTAGYGAAAPLAWAMVRGDMERVKLLLDYGADPDLDGAGLRAPILQAVEQKNMEAFELMWARGATGMPHDAEGQPPRLGEKTLYEVAKRHPGPVADAAITALDALEQKNMSKILQTMGTTRPIAVKKKPVVFKPALPLQPL